MIGTMRLGGMQPAEMYFELPKKFLVSRGEDFDNGYYMFCNHKEKDGMVLTWLTQDTILFNGNEYDLKYKPSYRNNWCVFTI